MDWTTWKPASCLPDCWCEATRVGSLILEPVNTWSNLGFMLVGIYLMVRAKNIFANVYGLSVLLIGIGSFFFHASQTFTGQWLDLFGMYLLTNFYICYNLYRINKVNIKSFFILYVSLGVLLGLALAYLPELRRMLFGLSALFALIQIIYIKLKFKPVMNTTYLVTGILTFIAAQTVWILDKNKIWCDPYAWINGHGIWHILCAIATLLIYRYFESEKMPDTLVSGT